MASSRTISRFLALLVAAGSSDASLSETEAKSLIQRHLEDGQNEYFQYDLSEWSLRFDRCQYVKMYDDEMAEDEESDTPLAIQHFAVFRLCPSDECDTCSEVFGRYVTEIEEYLQFTVQEQQKALEYTCQTCQEQCGDDDYVNDDESCSECTEKCYELENLEANGYVDAAEFIECQKLNLNNGDGEGEEGEGEENNNNGDDDLELYIGPRCSRNGERILIGLFSDEDCLDPYTDADPEDYLGYNISYHHLVHTYRNDGSNCLSCMESEMDANEEDQQDADDVNEMCEGVYNTAAKCESKYNLGGFIQTMREDENYENQVENEWMVCDFIESLIYDS